MEGVKAKYGEAIGAWSLWKSKGQPSLPQPHPLPSLLLLRLLLKLPLQPLLLPLKPPLKQVLTCLNSFKLVGITQTTNQLDQSRLEPETTQKQEWIFYVIKADSNPKPHKSKNGSSTSSKPIRTRNHTKARMDLLLHQSQFEPETTQKQEWIFYFIKANSNPKPHKS